MLYGISKSSARIKLKIYISPICKRKIINKNKRILLVFVKIQDKIYLTEKI